MVEVQKERTNKQLLTSAWIVIILASSIAIIIWRELFSGEPSWYPWIHAIGLLIMLVLTFIRPDLKPLRGYAFVFTVIFIIGYGGGWQWGLLFLIRSTSAWNDLINSTPLAISQILPHVLRLIPACIILIFFTLKGKKRKDYFLVKGEINAPIQPTKALGIKEPEPWAKTGIIFGTIFTAGTLIFLIISTNYTIETFIAALPLIPIAIIIAAINAFNEEFTLRAAPLSECLNELGRRRALMITTLYFGIGHYYGVPNGIIGVLLSSFLGWFLGKSMLETKGFFWAWIIHFSADVIIFSYFMMSLVI